MSLLINGVPTNGYTLNDVVYPSGTVSQQSLWKGSSKGKPVSALVDTATIWKPGTETYGTKNSIKIEFDSQLDGAWSLVGFLSSLGNPSMAFGFVDPPLEDFTWNDVNYPLSLYKYLHRNGCFTGLECVSNFKPGAVILHEFMHALGGSHEHQNAQENPLMLNVGAVYETYCGVPNPPEYAECKKSADFNVLSQYTCFNVKTNSNDAECYSYTDYDPDSILLYKIFDSWMAEGYKNPTKNNFRLSDSDKAWLKDFYPLNAKDKPIIEVTFNNGKEWEKAWVQKIVTEELAPYVGVQFVWPGMPLENPKVQSPTQTPTQSPTQSPTQTPTQAPTKPQPIKMDQTTIIALACLGAFLFLLIAGIAISRM